jgi:hypothetical protein
VAGQEQRGFVCCYVTDISASGDNWCGLSSPETNEQTHNSGAFTMMANGTVVPF